MTDISELNVDNMTVKLQVCKGLALILYSCSVLLLYSSGIDVLCCSTECGRVVTVLQCGIVGADLQRRLAAVGYTLGHEPDR